MAFRVTVNPTAKIDVAADALTNAGDLLSIGASNTLGKVALGVKDPDGGMGVALLCPREARAVALVLVQMANRVDGGQ